MLQKFVSYRKLGGWLLCFFVIQIIGAVMTGFSLVSLLSTQALLKSMGLWDPASQVFTFIVSVIGIAFVIAIAVLIGRRSRLAIKLFYVSCGVDVVTTILNYVLFPATTVEVPGMDASVAAVTSITSIFSLVLSFGVMIAWIIYFNKSERVRVYFLGNREYNDEYMARRQEYERQAAAMGYPPQGGYPPPPQGGYAPPPQGGYPPPQPGGYPPPQANPGNTQPPPQNPNQPPQQ